MVFSIRNDKNISEQGTKKAARSGFSFVIRY